MRDDFDTRSATFQELRRYLEEMQAPYVRTRQAEAPEPSPPQKSGEPADYASFLRTREAAGLLVPEERAWLSGWYAGCAATAADKRRRT